MDIGKNSHLESGLSANNELAFGFGQSSRYVPVRHVKSIIIPVPGTALVVKGNSRGG
jgi:hypothetical protein